MFGKDVIINATHRGIQYSDGKPVAILRPGRYKVKHYATRGYVDKFLINMPFKDQELLAELEDVLPKQVAKHLLKVTAKANEVVLVRADNLLVGIVSPARTEGYWIDSRKLTTEHIDVSDAPPIERKDVHEIMALGSGAAMYNILPKDHEGTLFIDGVPRESLKPGVYAYWNALRKVTIEMADMRQQVTEVTAQEILTKDRVSMRVTLTAFWKINDISKALGTADRETQLYRYIQFAIRDTVAKRTLDQLLDERSTLDAELTSAVKSMSGVSELGIGLEMVGVKDIILPGDMREILNRVVEAEKQSQANAIRRHEETAATRSLLNTARLMENNPLLLRMKELETLEKLTEKVGHLNVNTSATGSGLDALLQGLVSLGNGSKENND